VCGLRISLSGSTDRVDVDSARIQRPRWSLRQLLIALAALMNLVVLAPLSLTTIGALGWFALQREPLPSMER
jgi:hypothetical protein